MRRGSYRRYRLQENFLDTKILITKSCSHTQIVDYSASSKNPNFTGDTPTSTTLPSVHQLLLTLDVASADEAHNVGVLAHLL